jgi:hypothetical protein
LAAPDELAPDELAPDEPDEDEPEDEPEEDAAGVEAAVAGAGDEDESDLPSDVAGDEVCFSAFPFPFPARESLR